MKLKQSHTSRSEFPIQSDQVRSQTMSLFNFESIFGKPKEKKSPADEAKEWKRQLSREMRRIDRDMNDLTRAEKNAAAECKKLAKQNQLPAAKLLAKTLLHKLLLHPVFRFFIGIWDVRLLRRLATEEININKP